MGGRASSRLLNSLAKPSLLPLSLNTLLLPLSLPSTSPSLCRANFRAAAFSCPPSNDQPRITNPVSSDTGPGGGVHESGGQRAQRETKVQDLEEVLRPILRKNASSLPALSAAVFNSRGLVALGAVGHRKSGEEAEVTSSDLWHLGSNTKAMTATLAALFVEEKKISWTSSLADLFPDLIRSNRMHAAFRECTLEMLLAHRSGLATDMPSDIWSVLRKGTAQERRRWAVEQLLCRPPDSDPGGEYCYSNSGYMVAGVVLENVSDGQPWETLIRERLFDPLGMSTAGFGPPASAAGRDASADQPWGHRQESGVLGFGGVKLVSVGPGPGGDNPPALGPAGTVHCSLEDYGKFLRAHLIGARLARRGSRAARNAGPAEEHSGVLLSPDSWKKLHSPLDGKTEGYALGWFAAARQWAGGQPALMHSGSNTMFFLTAWLAPDKDLAMVVATNAGDAATAVDSVFLPLIQRFA